MAKEIIIAIIGSGVLSTVISALVSARQSKNAMTDGLKHVLYFQIRQGCLEAIKEGSIDDDSLRAIMEAWALYHGKLGGNGYLTALMDKVRQLPVECS